MGNRKWIVAGLLAGAAMVSTAAQALTASVFVGVAPPPPRYEVMPPARHGYVWVPGHWQWQGHGHVWVNGYYLRERPGYHYTQPRWQRQGHGWAYVPGGWAHAQYHSGTRYGEGWRYRDGYRDGYRRSRDRDRDGIPDHRDYDLDNDGRPNGRDRDMDGDGVRNWRDRAPANRWRY